MLGNPGQRHFHKTARQLCATLLRLAFGFASPYPERTQGLPPARVGSRHTAHTKGPAGRWDRAG